MNKKFSLKHPAGNVYFASDFHFRHGKDFIYKARGFDTIEEHDEFILKNLRELNQDDVLFYLGDFSLNSSKEDTLRLLNSIYCETYYILGNHENYVGHIIQDYQKGQEFWPVYHKNITFLGVSQAVKIYGQDIYLSHMASLIWDRMQYGAWHLCGHSHGNCPQLNPEDKNSGKVLDVGVDNCLKLVQRPFISFEEVETILKNKAIKLVDHHG